MMPIYEHGLITGHNKEKEGNINEQEEQDSTEPYLLFFQLAIFAVYRYFEASISHKFRPTV